MNLVIDASVALKWFVQEPQHEAALALLRGGHTLHAPDLLVIEVANAAWKKFARREISRDQAAAIAATCNGDALDLLASAPLVPRAFELAAELKHPVYDCLYLACAEAVDGVVVTADSGFAKAAARASMRDRVRPLDSFGGRALALSHSTIEHLLGLWRRSRATYENVYKELTGGKQFAGVNLAQLEPYALSPTIRRVNTAIERLSAEQQAEVLALGWLGRGYDGDDWSELRSRAIAWIGDRKARKENYVIYLVSLLNHLEAGLRKFHGQG